MSLVESNLVLWQMLVLTAVSFGVGILGGFVGLALGTMRLPAMLLMGMAAPAAGGTNIMVSSLASLSGALRHLREGRVDRRIVLVMGVPAFIGAFLGGFASDFVSERLLLAAAGALVLWQGVEFVILVRNRRRTGGPHMFGSDLEGSEGDFTPNRMSLEAGIGFGVGVLGGAVGLILGSIRLPALIRVLRVDPRIAAGSNLFIGFFMGSLGWIGHVSRGPGRLPAPGDDGSRGDDREPPRRAADRESTTRHAYSEYGRRADVRGRSADMEGSGRIATVKWSCPPECPQRPRLGRRPRCRRC